MTPRPVDQSVRSTRRICSAALACLPGTRRRAPRRNAILTLSYLIGALVTTGLLRQMVL
jgi:hypothetical protein